MKKFKYILVIILIALNSCGDVELRYYTRINPDGTVLKRVSAVGDSAKVYAKPFSFDPARDGWTIHYDKVIEDKDTLFMAIAEKTFPSIEATKMAFTFDVDSGQRENIEVKYNKKFRWFFTFHEYSETFLQRFPYHYYDIKDFLSDDEQLYFMKDDTTVINHLAGKEKDQWIEKGEKKFWQFLASSISAEYVSLLNKYALSNGYDEIGGKTQEKLNGIFYNAFNDGPELNEICGLTDSLINVSWIQPLYETGYFNKFEQELEDRMLLLVSRNYKVNFEVPGLIYDSNADEIDQQIVKWSFEGDLFQYADLNLYVHYRTANWWTFIITAFVILFVLVKTFWFSKGQWFRNKMN